MTMRIPLFALLAVMPVAFAPALSAQDKPRDTTSAPSSVVPLERTALEVDTVDRIVAVVGHTVITWSDVVTEVNQRRAAGMKLPDDVEEQLRVARLILNELVDVEILLQKATELNLELTDQELNSAVDNQVRATRQRFKDEIEYRAALREAGFGSPEEFRRSTIEQARRYLLQRKVFPELQKTAKPSSVTDQEIDEAFKSAREQLQRRPATITFRQIIMAPKPSPLNDSLARAKAESLLVAIKKGESFEAVAKRESMDPGSKDAGGDLGWQRRGMFVPEFDAVMFSLRPGQISPVIKTQFGYHIIRVDRVQPAEVKGSHILIAPAIDSNDIKRTMALGDSVASLWAGGANYDSLLTKFHERDEEKGVLEPLPLDTLPESYRRALEGVDSGQVTHPFQLVSTNNSVRIAILQVINRWGMGEYSLPEVRQNIRRQLAAEKQSRAILDGLRTQMYVSVRL